MDLLSLCVASSLSQLCFETENRIGEYVIQDPGEMLFMTCLLFV